MLDTLVTTGCYALFCGTERICTGAIGEVVRAAKNCVDSGTTERVALFDDSSGRALDIDYRGTVDEVLARLRDHPMLPQAEREALAPRGPGRPRLGVVAREVTLLPRHWDWLGEQPGGASVALRKLVDIARREHAARDLARRAQEATHRFMWDMAGNLPRFEEVSRAFYARDYARLDELLAQWPLGIAEHTRHLVKQQRDLEKLAAG
ncbi:MAG: DUF2239 family protein [Pseudomonadota bacterium]